LGDRRAISEIVSALLLTATTLSLGGAMTLSLSSQLSGSNQGILVALQQQQQVAGKLLSLPYSALSSGNLVIQIYDYGFTA
jgi:flagellin-like protein